MQALTHVRMHHDPMTLLEIRDDAPDATSLPDVHKNRVLDTEGLGFLAKRPLLVLVSAGGVSTCSRVTAYVVEDFLELPLLIDDLLLGPCGRPSGLDSRTLWSLPQDVQV